MVRGLLFCELVLVAFYLVDWALDHPISTLAQVVRLDGEVNLPTWFSSMQLLLLGVLIALAAGPISGWRDRRNWPVLAAALLCIAMSCEEVVQLHERFGERIDILLPGGTRKGSIVAHTGVWMFILAPPFIVAVAVLWRGFRPIVGEQPGLARRYRLGFVVYAVSVFGVEFLANFATPGGTAWVVEVVCEELGEMLGVTLLVWATLDLLASRRAQILFPELISDDRHPAPAPGR